MSNDLIEQLELMRAKAQRLKKARAEAELLLEKKSRELFEANQKLEAAQAKLEDDVEQATLELSVSNERLQRALNERSTFIGQMSHEVRTPLNAIIGLSEILHGTQLDEAQRDYVETINSGANSLIVLLNDMLDITKIEAGRVDISPMPVSSRRLHQNIVAMFALQAQEQGLRLSLDINDSLPNTIRIDKGRYKQIINNLISNALKNTEVGSVQVSVTYQPDSDNSGTGKLLTKVSDTGVGIEENQIGRIFNAYEQIGRPHQGVGLGLAICRQLSELMMGSVHCESQVGQGSVFTLTLPVESLSDAEVDNQDNEITVGYSPTSALKILIAEDNPVNQKVLTAQLSQLGQRADIVGNGKEAIQALEIENYDLVILDIMMPVMNGEEAITEIRASHDAIAKTYCVALTASTYKDQKSRLLALGFDAFLSKPLSLNELSQALTQVPMSNKANETQNAFTRFKSATRDPQASTSSSFDFSYLETQFGDAHLAVFKEIAPTFLEYAYQDLDALNQAVVEQDVLQVERISHSIKGAASSIGLSDLANVLLKVESAPASPSVHQYMDEINNIMELLKPMIEREIGAL